MSSISSVGTESLQYLWQMAQQDVAISTNRTQQAPPSGDGPPELWEDVEESAASAGLSEDQIDALKTDIKAAISSAMETAKDSEDREAGHQAVDDAILTTLQEYGVDTTEIENRMSEAKSRPQGGPPPDMNAGGLGSQSESEVSLLSLLSSSATSSQDDTSSLMSMLFPLIDEQA